MPKIRRRQTLLGVHGGRQWESITFPSSLLTVFKEVMNRCFPDIEPCNNVQVIFTRTPTVIISACSDSHDLESAVQLITSILEFLVSKEDWLSPSEFARYEPQQLKRQRIQKTLSFWLCLRAWGAFLCTPRVWIIWAPREKPPRHVLFSPDVKMITSKHALQFSMVCRYVSNQFEILLRNWLMWMFGRCECLDVAALMHFHIYVSSSPDWPHVRGELHLALWCARCWVVWLVFFVGSRRC